MNEQRDGSGSLQRMPILGVAGDVVIGLIVQFDVMLFRTHHCRYLHLPVDERSRHRDNDNPNKGPNAVAA